MEESLRMILEERGSREMKETPLFSYVLRRSPPFMLRSPFTSPSGEERARTVTVK